MKETLGDRYTDQMGDLYKRVIKFVLNLLIVGYNQRDRVDSNKDSSMANDFWEKNIYSADCEKKRQILVTFNLDQYL